MHQYGRLATVTVEWVSILYLLSTVLSALFPRLAEIVIDSSFHLYRLGATGRPIITLVGLLIGLLGWNVIAVIAVNLFAWLWNHTKA